jgi:hypothetical protein
MLTRSPVEPDRSMKVLNMGFTMLFLTTRCRVLALPPSRDEKVVARAAAVPPLSPGRCAGGQVHPVSAPAFPGRRPGACHHRTRA